MYSSSSSIPPSFEPKILKNLYNKRQEAEFFVIESQSGRYSIAARIRHLQAPVEGVLGRLARAIPGQTTSQVERVTGDISVELYSDKKPTISLKTRNLSSEKMKLLFNLLDPKDSFYDENDLHISVSVIFQNKRYSR